MKAAVLVEQPLRERHGVALGQPLHQLGPRRPLEVDVELDLGQGVDARTAHRSTSVTTGAGDTPPSPTTNAARSASAARCAPASSRACTTASGRSPGPTRSPRAATSVSPTLWSTRSASRARPPPRPTMAIPTARTSTVDHGPGLHRRGGAHHRGGGQMAVWVLEQVRRPAQLGHHGRESLPRRSAVKRALGGRASAGNICRHAAQHEQLGAERHGHLPQTLVARGAGEVIDGLADLHRVAGGAAQHLIHVGEQRRGGHPVAPRDVDDRSGQLAGLLHAGQECPRADLDVHHQGVQPGGELLGEDGADDQRDRLDRARRVADGVQTAVGGREPARLADDRAADAGHRRAQPAGVRSDVIAGDRLELVQRAARVAQAPPGDHRHRGPAGGHDRRQQQAHLVADAAGRVLVQHRAVDAGPVPLQDVARARHRAGQRHALVRRHAPQEDRHRQRAHLGVAHRAVGDARHQLLDLRAPTAPRRRACAG